MQLLLRLWQLSNQLRPLVTDVIHFVFYRDVTGTGPQQLGAQSEQLGLVCSFRFDVFAKVEQVLQLRADDAKRR